MNPERWQQIKRLYSSALELESKPREAFLEEACAGDESLRREIDLLLARRPEAEGLFEAPVMELAAQALARDRSAEPSTDLSGSTLLHYSVTRKIGAGGMGEVYQARDLKLNRQVALKILPDSFAHDPERLARFDREAKLIASLNHPNIAAIYGLEEARDKKFLVLELVEGETLAQRIKKGRLPMEEALELCRQIAEGLETAHEKGVVHRDLKPANVMIAGDDKIKILDFGLAKVLAAESAATAATQSPTVTEAMTGPGMILGTAAYMSPEQANGKVGGQACGYLGIRLHRVRVLDGKTGVSGRYGFGDNRVCPRPRARLGCVACDNSASCPETARALPAQEPTRTDTRRCRSTD